MRKRTLALAILLVSSTASASPRVHVVGAGESLGELARRYGTSVDALRAMNQLEGDLIRVGQELRVDEADAVDVVEHRIVPGDTLLCIARRYGVTMARIREDNPTLRGRLEAGTTIVLRGARVQPEAEPDERIVHRVRAGENLARIARRYGVAVADLLAENDVDPARLAVGSELVVSGGTRSESVGAPTCGSIRGGVQVEAHRGFVLRNPARAWGTRRSVRRLRGAFDAVVRAHPNAARVRVHDLSLEGGGAIDDHRSHQSGRDVDITYYQRRGCEAEGCPLRRVDPGDLDVRRQWTLLRHWLREGDAEAIFIDYALQEPLYREAERRGATRAQLERWFQYPRGRWHSEGVIRHFPKHRDHIHVRFVCDEGEPDCR